MQNLSSLGDRLTQFSGGKTGEWNVLSTHAIKGKPLSSVTRISIHHTPISEPHDSSWILTGISSNARYTERKEKSELSNLQAHLGRPEARLAALIPIKKSVAWWELTQDERRAIFEKESSHISYSMKYLPAIARKLLHSRDLGEPFDFLTWFEYAPEHAADFDALVSYLRQTSEWNYVEREVDIRLSRI